MELPRRRQDWLKVVAVVAVVVVAYQLIKRALPDIDAQDLLEDVSASLGSWTYLIVGLLAFLETGAFVGLVAPGETVVVLAGAVAGQGATSVVLTIGVVWLSAYLGDTCSYLLGDRLGRDWVVKHGPRLRITPERFKQVEDYFARHGGKTILVGRFIGLVRALAPFVAGSSRMPYRQLAPYSILGTGLWATLFTLLGYYASKNIDAVLSNSEHALFAFAVIVALIVGGIVAYRWMRVPENRARLAAEMEKRPVLRTLLALGRRLSPQARFLLNRLTPGGLGLEFTTALAALAVGSYVAVAYALVVDETPGPTTGDTTVADFVANIRADWLTTIAKGFTALGSWEAIAIAAVATAAWLIVRRAWPELVVLVLGAIAIFWANRSDQGRGGPAASRRRSRRREWLRLSQRPCRAFDRLRVDRVDDRDPAPAGDEPGHGAGRRGTAAGGRHRSQPRLSRRPLHERRQRRLGPRRLHLRVALGRRRGRRPLPAE